MKNSIFIPLLLLSALMISITQLSAQIDTWVYLNELPSERGFSASTVLDNKIYIIGGFPDSDQPAMSEVIAYDPIADSYIMDIADLPLNLGRTHAEALNGKIYVVGGHTANWGDNMLPSLYEYDPILNSWTQKADMLQRRFNHSTAVLDGKLVAVAGRTENYPAPVDNTVEMYDPVTDSWSFLPDMNLIRAGHVAEVVDGKLYVLAGSISTDLSPAIEVYDPYTDQWSEHAEMTNRWGHGSVVLDGAIYFFGGADYIQPLPDIWKYDIVNDSLIDVEASMPDILAYPAHGLLEDELGNQCVYVLGGTTADWWTGGAGPHTSSVVLKYCPNLTTVSVLGEAAVAALKYSVYPNPSSGQAYIEYELANATDVRIVVLDQAGRVVEIVLNEYQSSGAYSFFWDSEDLADGVYYCKIYAADFIATQQLIIQR